MRFHPLFLAAALLVLLLHSAAAAATFLVLPSGAGDFPKIQDAIDAADTGDEIVLGDGTFLGPRNRDLVLLGKTLTIRSQSGDPALCIIDCEAQSRGLSMTPGETAVVIEGITIRNGFGPWGGGLNLTNVTASWRGMGWGGMERLCQLACTSRGCARRAAKRSVGSCGWSEARLSARCHSLPWRSNPASRSPPGTS